MNHMSHLTLMPRSLGLRRRISQLNTAFLDGYRSEPDSATVDEMALLWLRTVHATSFLERYRSTGATMLHEAYFRLAAGYNLRLLCKRLSGAV
jgi:hypothetical protein